MDSPGNDPSASGLPLSTVGVKVGMTALLVGAQPSHQEPVSVGVDHVHKVSVSLVKPHVRGVALVTAVNILQKNKTKYFRLNLSD